ncbi:MAG: hypothetical protein J6Q22_09555 [Prevotella sp.]|nr:hypothetical protein [Prevotella sp.]
MIGLKRSTLRRLPSVIRHNLSGKLYLLRRTLFFCRDGRFISVEGLERPVSPAFLPFRPRYRFRERHVAPDVRKRSRYRYRNGNEEPERKRSDLPNERTFAHPNPDEQKDKNYSGDGQHAYCEHQQGPCQPLDYDSLYPQKANRRALHPAVHYFSSASEHNQ